MIDEILHPDRWIINKIISWIITKVVLLLLWIAFVIAPIVIFIYLSTFREASSSLYEPEQVSAIYGIYWIGLTGGVIFKIVSAISSKFNENLGKITKVVSKSVFFLSYIFVYIFLASLILEDFNISYLIVSHIEGNLFNFARGYDSYIIASMNVALKVLGDNYPNDIVIPYRI